MVDQIVVQSDPVKRPWTILVTCFVLITFVGFLGQVIFREFLPTSSEFFLQKFPGMFSYLIPALYFSFRYGPIKITDFLPKGSDFIILFAALIFVFIQAGLVALISPLKPYSIQGTSLFQLPKIELFLILFAFLAAGPFFEELLFRKYILEVLKKNYNVLFAVIAVSLLETAIHIGFILEWPLDLFRSIRFFIYFSILCAIYLKSNLGVSFITHSLINTTIMFVTWR